MQEEQREFQALSQRILVRAAERIGGAQELAGYLGIDEATLREMNPALRRGIAPPGTWSLRVPAQAAQTIAARAATLRIDDARIAVCTYTLRDGDSPARIARVSSPSCCRGGWTMAPWG